MQSIIARRTTLALTGLAASACTTLAMAHMGLADAPHPHHAGNWGSFQLGALHPFTGLDHLAAMLSVGVWSALTMAGPQEASVAKRRAWPSLLAMPLAFVLALLAGALFGMGGARLPGVEPMIATSLLLLGLLVATRKQMGAAAGVTLVALFALFHGWAHGAELGTHGGAALAGMALSTAALHGMGIALGLAMRDQGKRAQRLAARAVGGGVALLGLGLLTPALINTL